MSYIQLYLAINSKRRFLLALSLHTRDRKFEVHLIDRYPVVTGVVLQHAGQERLGEVETRYPEDYWWTLVYPVLEEL